LEKKKEMLKMNDRQLVGKNVQTPEEFIKYLGRSDLSMTKILQCMESLRVALTSNKLDWVHQFGARGLDQILHILKECFNK